MTHNGNAAAYTALVSSLQQRAAKTDYSSREAARADLARQGAFTEEPRVPPLGDA